MRLEDLVPVGGPCIFLTDPNTVYNANMPMGHEKMNRDSLT
jgi:hypothetical protein